jgi:hypothetical protein
MNYLAHIQHIIAIISFIYCLIIYLTNKSEKILIIFCLYPVLSIIADNITLYQLVQNTYNKAASLFTIFEFFLFLLLINKYSKSKKVQIYSIITGILYAALASYAISTNSLSQAFEVFVLFENMFLLPACCYYLFKLFKTPDITEIHKKFSFWIVLGIAFYIFFTTPYFIFQHALPKEYAERFFVINTIGYIVMHLLFIKGYLCLKNKK